MSQAPTEHGGQGAVSLGFMVVVCEAFERSVAQSAAEILEANGIPALLQSSQDGLPNIPTPPPQSSDSVFIVVPSTLEKEAVRILRAKGTKQKRSSSKAVEALQWSRRWSAPQIDDPESESLEKGQPIAEEEIFIRESLPDSGPVSSRVLWALLAIFFGIGLQLVLEGLLGERSFRTQFAANSMEPSQWYRLVTAGFVHFSFSHHFYNALFGLIMGVVLFGSHRVGATMATWLVASVLGIFGQLTSTDAALVAGASAGNYGLIGLWAKGQLERSRLVMLPKRERLRTLGVLLLLVPGALTPSSSSGASVAVLAHVIGFVGGFVMGGVFHRRLGHAPNPVLEQRAQWGLYCSVAVTALCFLRAMTGLSQ
ncbi:MAG: rhomboid family intramembrane serine protease [Myxococcota bacterium]|nr:rhomboid family intramembrane serine protease [Myxococcota bacterium]